MAEQITIQPKQLNIGQYALDISLHEDKLIITIESHGMFKDLLIDTDLSIKIA